MTQDQFNKWLNDPGSMNSDSIPQLREVIKRYPYFNVAQMLLAKNLRSENHIDQLKQLQLAAVMAPDRKVFHDYLNDRKKVVPAKLDEPTVVEIEPAEAETADQEITKPEPRFPDELIPEPVIYQLETADLPELPVKEEQKSIEPEELSFSEWLAFTESGELTEAPSEKSQGKIPVGEELSGIDIIDHFLSQADELPKKRAEFFDPRKAAAKADKDDFTVVSETLAKIYFQQEKYELAKQAYRSLSLNYPEKSVYFAARLKEIEEKLNSEG
ncbi:MAG: hypothetical protein H6602_04885 [Flavobacteriales bacterium]|nr:hypothetical protein [Flavobacteriales bacterium]